MERLHTEAEQERTRSAPVARRQREQVERRRALAVRTQLALVRKQQGQGRLRSSVVVGRTRPELGQMRHTMIQHRKRQALVRKRELVERSHQHRRLGLELHMPVLLEHTRALGRKRALGHRQGLVGCRLAVGWEPSKPQRAGGQRGLVAGCRTGKLGQADRDGEEARI